MKKSSNSGKQFNLYIVFILGKYNEYKAFPLNSESIIFLNKSLFIWLEFDIKEKGILLSLKIKKGYFEFLIKPFSCKASIFISYEILFSYSGFICLYKQSCKSYKFI